MRTTWTVTSSLQTVSRLGSGVNPTLNERSPLITDSGRTRICNVQAREWPGATIRSSTKLLQQSSDRNWIMDVSARHCSHQLQVQTPTFCGILLTFSTRKETATHSPARTRVFAGSTITRQAPLHPSLERAARATLRGLGLRVNWNLSKSCGRSGATDMVCAKEEHDTKVTPHNGAASHRRTLENRLI